MLNFKFIFFLFIVVYVNSSFECEGDTDVCSRPLVDPGYCRASFRRYGFDGEKCTEFIWGGCDDNGNNFETLEQCQTKCEINN